MVEVIELPAAASLYGFSDAKRSSGPKPVKKTQKSTNTPRQLESTMKLRDAKRDVYELGSSGLSKRARRVVEAERVEAFCGTKVKAQKMPLKMLMGIRRAEAKRAAREAEERRAAGVVAPKERQDAVTRKATKRKRQPQPLIDDIRNGVLRVSPAVTGRAGDSRRSKKK